MIPHTRKPSDEKPEGLSPITAEPVRRFGLEHQNGREPRPGSATLTCNPDCPAQTGHFYFALNRTFLLRPDTIGRGSDGGRPFCRLKWMVYMDR